MGASPSALEKAYIVCGRSPAYHKRIHCSKFPMTLEHAIASSVWYDGMIAYRIGWLDSALKTSVERVGFTNGNFLWLKFGVYLWRLQRDDFHSELYRGHCDMNSRVGGLQRRLDKTSDLLVECQTKRTIAENHTRQYSQWH